MVDVSACGNRRIDALAQRGRLMSVWDRLAYRDARIAAAAEQVWIARKDGRIRRLVEREPRYAALLENAARGPQSDDEWALLADACLEAIRPQSHGAVRAGIGGSVAPQRTAAA